MKQIIMLFGPPGSGKGTQANLLAEKTGYYHFETSKIIERCFKQENPEKVYKIEGKEYKVKDEIEKWETGLLVDPPFVFQLLKERVKELASEGESIIFSGSPRTIYEAEKELPLFKKLYGKNIQLILLEVNPETTIQRNSHRKICSLMKHNILFSPETENLKKCPIDGSDLASRFGLDDVETIKKRLEVFQAETYPVVAIVEKEGISVTKINGEQTISEVYNEIQKVVK